jgi:hypothetical protein
MVGPWFESRPGTLWGVGGGSSMSYSDEENVKVLYNSAVPVRRHINIKILRNILRNLKYHGHFKSENSHHPNISV